jgi:hypothetical protein
MRPLKKEKSPTGCNRGRLLKTREEKTEGVG